MPSEKTTGGVLLSATQRSLAIGADPKGLEISAEVGHGRGFAVRLTLTLDEIAAWMPDLIAQQAARTDMLVRAAEQRMRSLAADEGRTLGVTLPYLSGDPRHGPEA